MYTNQSKTFQCRASLPLISRIMAVITKLAVCIFHRDDSDVVVQSHNPRPIHHPLTSDFAVDAVNA